MYLSASCQDRLHQIVTFDGAAPDCDIRPSVFAVPVYPPVGATQFDAVSGSYGRSGQ